MQLMKKRDVVHETAFDAVFAWRKLMSFGLGEVNEPISLLLVISHRNRSSC